MCKIRIRNFGPVSSGYGLDSGWMEISKITLFCGPQGSGKSSAAKLLSLLSWIEKSAYRDPELKVDRDVFVHALEWQNIAGYVKPDTEIEYQGNLLRFAYVKGDVSAEYVFDERSPYVVPKISYMPAERNFTSIVRNANRVEGLPRPLIDMLVEFRHAEQVYANGFRLPANGFKFVFDRDPWIVNGDGPNANKTRLEESSSGLQSMVPMLLVSEYLTSRLAMDGNSGSMGLFYDPGTAEKKERIDTYIRELRARENLTADQMRDRLELFFAPGRRFLNIVEEPEQNLYPETQCEVVDRLLALANAKPQSSLLLSTHSPYIVNHLQLVAQAEEIARTSGMAKSVVSRLPMSADALIAAVDMRLYEMHMDGSITLLRSDDGYISDANPLNCLLADFNEQYARLLEIGDFNLKTPVEFSCGVDNYPQRRRGAENGGL